MSSGNTDSPDDVESRLDRLEEVVERQQETIEQQQRLIERQQEQLEAETEEADDESDGPVTSRFSRRSLLQAAGVVGLAGYGTGVGAADPQGEIGTSSDPLRALYTQQLNGGVTGEQSVSSLTGTGLSVDEESLSAADAADDHVDIADAGTSVVEDADELDFGANVSASDDGDGTVTVDGENVAVEESGSTVLEDPSVIDFRSNLDVTTASGGEVLVDASGGGGSNPVDIEDGGTSVVSDASIINFASSLSVTNPSGSQVDVDASGAAAWEDATSSNDLLEPTSTPKGLEIDQLSTSDPDISSNKGALYASDGSVTGSSGDVVIGADDGGTDATPVVLYEYANNGIPGGSLTSGSVTDTEIDLSITPTWTATHTFDGSPALQSSSDFNIKLDAGGGGANAFNVQDDGGTDLFRVQEGSGNPTENLSGDFDINAGNLTFAGDTNTHLNHPATNELAITTNGSEAMRVDPLQNVGIGTDNPGETLEVAGTAQVSGETSIKADLQSNNTGIGSNTWTNIVDNQTEDNNGEFTGGQINLNKTADYLIIAQATIAPDADQDTLVIRLRDVDSGTTQKEKQIQASGGGNVDISLQVIEGLSFGQNHEVQVTDKNHSYDLLNNRTYVIVKRSLVD